MTITGGKPKNIKVSEATKAKENLKYIIFLLLHLDNNNYNIALTTPNIKDDIDEDTVIIPGNRPIDEIYNVINKIKKTSLDDINKDTVITPSDIPNDETPKVINDKKIYFDFINELKHDLRPIKEKKDLNEQPFVDVIKTILLNRVNLNYHYYKDLPSNILDDILEITQNIVKNEPARKKEIMDNVMFTQLSKENLNSVSLSKMISNDKPADNRNIIYTLYEILNNLLYLKKIQCEQYAAYGKQYYMIDDKSYFNKIEGVLGELYTQLDIIEPIPKRKKNIQSSSIKNSVFNDIKKLFSTTEEEKDPKKSSGKILDDKDDDKDDEINTLKQTITNVKQQCNDNNNMKEQQENAIGLKGYTIPSKDGTGYVKNSKGNYLWNTSIINNNKDLPYNTTDTVDVYLHRLFTQIANETTGHIKKQSDQAEKHIENAKSVFEFKTGGKKTGGKKTKGKKRYKNKSRRKYKK